jgi:hypothetical protein
MEIRLTGKRVFWGIVVIIVIAGAATWIWMDVLAAQNPNGPSPYSAVYLTSGDVYFGKLSWFPSPHMTDVWYLNRTAGPNGQAQISVAPFKGAFWGPMDEINFNPKQILYWTRLSNASQLVKGLENPSSLPGGTSSASGAASASSTSATGNTTGASVPTAPTSLSSSSTPAGK